MTVYTHCDYCGQPIDDDDESITISTHGRQEVRGSLAWETANWTLGHYHATLVSPCFDEMWERMQLVHDVAPTLENIPVASAQKIAQLRGTRGTGGRRHVEGISAATRVSDLGLAYRAVCGLWDGGIHTLADVAKFSESELSALRYVGPHTIAGLKKALADCRLAPRRDVIDDLGCSEPISLSSCDASDLGIDGLNIRVRTYKALRHAGIITFGQLQAACKDKTLSTVPGLGQKGLDEIERAVAKYLAGLERLDSAQGA